MVQVKGLRKLHCENREASGKVFAELFPKSDLPRPQAPPTASTILRRTAVVAFVEADEEGEVGEAAELGGLGDVVFAAG